MNFSYKNKTDDLFVIQEGFTFPSFSKQVEYHPGTHSILRRKKRQTRQPFSFMVPIILLKGKDEISRDDLTTRLSRLLNSYGPEVFKIEETNWYYLGEFTGPYLIPPDFDKFTTTEVEFVSPYSHKFYDGDRTQQGDTININTKTQIPTIPLIELTGLTGSDVQISNSKKDGSFKQIRLTGTLPAGITIDPQKETIFTTSTGTERLDLLRIDSNFEDFTLEDGDVITLTNAGETASAKLTYKELML